MEYWVNTIRYEEGIPEDLLHLSDYSLFFDYKREEIKHTILGDKCGELHYYIPKAKINKLINDFIGEQIKDVNLKDVNLKDVKQKITPILKEKEETEEKKEEKLIEKEIKPIVHEKKEIINIEKCHICKYNCESKLQLLKHYRKLHKGKAYTFKSDVNYCLMCDKKIRSYHYRRKHKNKEGKLECSICGFTAHRSSSFREHLRTHNKEENPYQCVICDIKMSQISNMKKHISFIHRI